MKTAARAYPATSETSSTGKQGAGRFTVSLDGICSIDGGPDIACAARSLSLDDIVLRCRPRVGLASNVVFSLPQIGLLRGRVKEIMTPDVVVRFEGSRGELKRVTNYLTWLIARGGSTTIEGREFERLVPLRRIVSMVADDGTSTARIVDVSRSGVALTTTRKLKQGMSVVIGKTEAVVVRELEDGLAARFARPLDASFDASIIL